MVICQGFKILLSGLSIFTCNGSCLRICFFLALLVSVVWREECPRLLGYNPAATAAQDSQKSWRKQIRNDERRGIEHVTGTVRLLQPLGHPTKFPANHHLLKCFRTKWENRNYILRAGRPHVSIFIRPRKRFFLFRFGLPSTSIRWKCNFLNALQEGKF